MKQILYADIDAKHGFPEGTMAALVHRESRGNPNAVSQVGAKGLCQFMPGTQKEMLQKTGLDAWSHDPKIAVEAGAVYLESLVKRYNGDLGKGLAAYNFGGRNLNKAIARALKNGTSWLSELPKETRDYVPAILKGVGVTEVEIDSTWNYQKTDDHTDEQRKAQYSQRVDILKKFGVPDEQISSMKPADMLGTFFFVLLLQLINQKSVMMDVTPTIPQPDQGQSTVLSVPAQVPATVQPAVTTPPQPAASVPQPLPQPLLGGPAERTVANAAAGLASTRYPHSVADHTSIEGSFIPASLRVAATAPAFKTRTGVTVT